MDKWDFYMKNLISNFLLLFILVINIFLLLGKPGGIQESAGEDHVAGGIWVDTVPGDRVCVAMAEDFIHRGLGVDTNGPVFARNLFHGLAVLIHHGAHRVSGIGFDIKRGH